MDERLLTEELIGYDTSREEGIKLCAGFVKGWLEARDIAARQLDVRGLPVTIAQVGPKDAERTVLLHGHVDVVPGNPEQFKPRLEDDRLYGRGAYDMKGALACLMLATADLRDQREVRVRLGIVPDEESEEDADRGGDLLVEEGFTGDFAITGEPTDMDVGVAAKGVLAMRIVVPGRAAHGATPWLGDNAILRAYEVFRELESLPFASQSSELFHRPSINLGRILGGDALNKVPDSCAIDVDVRYLPEQDPEEILAQVRELPGARVIASFSRPPVLVDPDSAYVRALREAAAPHSDGRVRGVVGRDGASDAVSFVRAGVPAVEFGPHGGGHHGPDEWVSVPSLGAYRRAIVDFVRELPRRLQGEAEGEDG
ncbi:MAG TPA: M20/M25/M40 family metallo-hydrolase [Solirubrobacterales bacterium]|nr:M20/M25/M40 family metallo-hydrolase [Solirubrobacterales bacterium]